MLALDFRGSIKKGALKRPLLLGGTTNKDQRVGITVNPDQDPFETELADDPY